MSSINIRASSHLRLRCLLALGALAVGAMLAMELPLRAAESGAGASKPARAFVPEPDGYRTEDYRKPVPATLKGAHVLDDAQANRLWLEKKAIFIDVYPHAPKPANLPPNTLWREPRHQTIEDAVWLPNVGYGALSKEFEDYFKTHLHQLTGGDASKPLVFFCMKDCWMSWNAAKRAMSYGYAKVYWYPDGTDGWQETGGMPVDVRPMP